MDASQLLHADLFELLRQSFHSGRTRELEAWFAGLATGPPEDAARELVQRLATRDTGDASPEMRFRLLAACDDAAEKILPALEDATEAASLPLTPEALHTARAADSLLKALAAAYVELMATVAGNPEAAGAGELLPAAALRATQMLARRQLFDYRAHAAPSPASWQQLHETYRRALDHGLIPTRNNGGGAISAITSEYVTALLFALAEPGHLPREQLLQIHALSATLAALAKLLPVDVTESDPACRFLVAGDPARPAQALARLPEGKPLPPRALVLDCSAIIIELDRLIATGAEATLPIETLQQLRDAWSAAATSPRRFARTQFKPRVDMIAGLPAILHLIAGKSPGRRQNDGGGDETSTSEWLVINESPDGFGIRHLGGTAPMLTIGDLVLLRPRERGKIHVCLVRRGNHARAGHADIGVQLLSSSAAVIPLPSEDIVAIAQQGLLLPRLPAFGNAAGIITAAGALTPQSVITENQAGTLKYYRLGARIATSTAIEFHLLQSA
ncbi:MAG: hypothetical protein KJ787_05290 [Gammaproteobacteria bacterium]|nr:hypothetical protein [Gammaproteobacteria bacterium]MBU1645726.1 hypothetical protein [Gammaproteobacteria bacterium]MBU1971234.1 hypothetical protein [Gammaproteobacteria bacterium]